MSLDGVLVTGASRGIGSAIALELARAGFVVGCLSRGGVLPADGGAPPAAHQLVPFRCDVTREPELAAAVAGFAAGVDRLVGLVNNAGIHLTDPSDQLPAERLRSVLETNLVGPFTLCREAFPHLARARRSVIVNIGSFYDRLGVKQNLAYCASKAGLAALTRCLAVEWSHHGIAVVDVAPGYVRTDINAEFLDSDAGRELVRCRIPAGRPGNTSEVALLVRRLIEDRMCFLTGTTIYLDGGQSVAL